MRRDQLEHADRTACQIIGADAVYVVGRLADVGPAHSPAAERAQSWLASWT